MYFISNLYEGQAQSDKLPKPQAYLEGPGPVSL